MAKLRNKRHKGLFKEFTEQCDGAGFAVTADILDVGTFEVYNVVVAWYCLI